MANINYYVGDERPNLSGVLTYTGSPDLSGATVKINAITNTGVKGIDDQSCTITIDNSAKTIDWSYTTTSSDFTVIGTYYVYLVTTFSGGDVLSTPASDQIEVQRPYG